MSLDQVYLQIVTELAMRNPSMISHQIHKQKNGVKTIGIPKKNKFIIENGKIYLENMEGDEYKKWDISIKDEIYLYVGGNCFDLDEFIKFLRGDLKKIEIIPSRSTGRPGGEKLRGTSRFFVRN